MGHRQPGTNGLGKGPGNLGLTDQIGGSASFYDTWVNLKKEPLKLL